MNAPRPVSSMRPASGALMSIDEAALLVRGSGSYTVAGEEALLRRLPRGRWIGGTIPYFMRPETIAGSVALMKELGIVDSGDAHTLGIGAMRPERVRDFLDKMVRAGLYRPGEVDPARAVTTRFVNRGVGGELAERLKGKRP